MAYHLLKPTDLIKINKEKGLRVICHENTVIHCHHYNARLQNTIESEKEINGKKIIREAAEVAFFFQIKNLLNENQFSKEDSFLAISDLYSTMGYGNLFFDKIAEGLVYSTSSHYVSGWQCGSVKRDGPVCTVVEGYIAAALLAVTGIGHDVSEHTCMNSGEKQCHFVITKNSAKQIPLLDLKKVEVSLIRENDTKSNINKQAIIDAVTTLPVYGNDLGLVPVFNVYLANTPQSFYNLICLNYLQEMDHIGRGNVAKMCLVKDAEFCAMNTFSGIKNSDEWMALIQPMVKNKADDIFGLLAVANALGWGRICVREHTPGESLSLIESNGYEAFGYLQLKNEIAKEGQCFMLAGIASGLMSLIYENGNFSDRVGLYLTTEKNCLCRHDHHCEFVTKKLD